MPNEFDIVFPSKGRVKFSGGLNNKYEKQLISDNETPDAFNVVLTADSAQTRGGTSKLNTTAVGSFAGDGLYTRHNNNGTQTMVAWWNGSLFTLNGTSSFVTVASAQSIFTAGERVTAAEYENYIFFGNGYTTPYKYNGAFTRHGIPQASAPTYATLGTAGNVTGDVRYKVSYVNSALVEGDVSSSTATLAASNEIVTVTVPTAPASFGVERRNLYRADAGSTFKRVTQITDNSTTTYSDNTATASLGTDAPTDQGRPPNYSALIYHKNRLFCNDPANQNYVWYSELGNPYVFKATSFIKAGDNSGDLVRGFAVYDDALVVFCDNSQWIIYMPSETATDWSPAVKLRSNYGSKNHFGSFKYNNKIMFPAIQSNKIVGFAALNGQAIDQSATFLTVSAIGSDLKSDRIEPDIFQIEESGVAEISAFVFQNKAYITLPFGTNQASNNRIYVFDFSIADLLKKQDGAWIPWTGLNAVQFTEYNGKLYYQSSTANGTVYEMNTSTYNDDGAAINSYLWTKEFPGLNGQESSHKDFRSVDIVYERLGDYYMTVRYKTDSDTGVGRSEQIDLNPGGSLWGTMRWGSDSWGGGQSDGETQITLGNVRGQRIQFRFDNQNTVNQGFHVKGLNFFYNVKNRRGRR